MICERCGGLKILDHFYGTTPLSTWKCDGFRCLNCGAVTYLPMPVGASRPVERIYRKKPTLRIRPAELTADAPVPPNTTFH